MGINLIEVLLVLVIAFLYLYSLLPVLKRSFCNPSLLNSFSFEVGRCVLCLLCSLGILLYWIGNKLVFLVYEFLKLLSHILLDIFIEFTSFSCIFFLTGRKENMEHHVKL